MRRKSYSILLGTALACLLLVINPSGVIDASEGEIMKSFSNVTDNVIQLPAPLLHGGMSIEETLAKRESTRNFTSKPLTPSEISQVLWAAQGITRNWGEGLLLPREHCTLSNYIWSYEKGYFTICPAPTS
jgi:hypothetical protein